MAIKAEEIDPGKLPIAMRGYSRGATDELLKRVAWDYRQLQRAQEAWDKDEQRLREQVEELDAQVTKQQEEFTKAIAARESLAGGESAAGASMTELQAENAELQAKNTDLQAEVDRLQAEIEELRNTSADADPDEREELVKTLLKTAQRAAREIREKAKKDADTLLAEARDRAEEIEAGAHEGARNSAEEVERLQRLEQDLRTRLRSTLEAVLGENGAAEAEANGAHEPEPEHWPTASID